MMRAWLTVLAFCTSVASALDLDSTDAGIRIEFLRPTPLSLTQSAQVVPDALRLRAIDAEGRPVAGITIDVFVDVPLCPPLLPCTLPDASTYGAFGADGAGSYVQVVTGDDGIGDPGAYRGGTVAGNYQVRATAFASSTPRNQQVIGSGPFPAATMRVVQLFGLVDADGSRAIEYASVGIAHYFYTSDPAEAYALDTGVNAGWFRTGATIPVYRDSAPPRAPVCRYWLSPLAGGSTSHFFSAFPQECELASPWLLESRTAFHVELPAPNGTCRTGTQPVYRLLSPFDASHRLTTSPDVRAQMIGSGNWIAEGYGSGVVMCVPLA